MLFQPVSRSRDGQSPRSTMPSKTKKMKTSGPEHSDLTPWLSDSPQMNIGKYYEPKKFVWAKDEIDERELKYLVEVEVEEKDEDHEQLYQNISPECNCTGNRTELV